MKQNKAVIPLKKSVSRILVNSRVFLDIFPFQQLDGSHQAVFNNREKFSSFFLMYGRAR
jgi:hypothetical protein